MNRYARLRRLIWKDWAAVRSLVSAAVAAVFLLNLFFLAAWSSVGGSTESLVGVAVTVGLGLPMLTALGAPPMLMGNEEEAGTLDWLRVLPVDWIDVATSKLVVGIGAVAVVGAIATLGFVFSMTVGNVLWEDAGPRANGGVYALQVLVTILVLVAGFIAALLVRSSVGSLLLTFPLAIVACVTMVTVTRTIHRGLGLTASLTAGGWASACVLWAVGGCCVALAIALKLVLFRHRMVGASGGVLDDVVAASAGSIHGVAGPAVDPQSPRPLGVDVFTRPTPAAAMLWQHGRQTHWLVAVIGSALLLLQFPGFVWLVSSVISGRPLAGDAVGVGVLEQLLVLGVPLGGCWLGAVAFIGDSTRQRCGFFADRGVSPTLVWATRLLRPALVTVAVIAASLVIQWIAPEQAEGISRSGRSLVLIFLPIGFATGQLIAMWTDRPILAFFAAPIGLYLGAMATAVCTALYPALHGWLLLSVLVLLFATWRLTGDWLDQRRGRWFGARALGYAVLAVIVPTLVMVGIRIAGMPPAMKRWRSEMRGAVSAVPGEEAFGARSPAAFPAVESAPWPAVDVGTVEFDRAAARPGTLRRDKARFKVTDAWSAALERELAEERFVGAHVSFGALESALKRSDAEYRPFSIAGVKQSERVRAVEVLLKWAHWSRAVAIGKPGGLQRLEEVGEPAETLAVGAIAAWTASAEQDDGPSGGEPMRAILARLVALVPDSDLRTRSRIAALKLAWAEFDRQRRRSSSVLFTAAAAEKVGQRSVAEDSAFFMLERVRGQRMVDAAVAETLEQLEIGIPRIGSGDYRRRMRLWHQAGEPTRTMTPSRRETVARHTANWGNETERAVAEIRQRLSFLGD